MKLSEQVAVLETRNLDLAELAGAILAFVLVNLAHGGIVVPDNREVLDGFLEKWQARLTELKAP